MHLDIHALIAQYGYLALLLGCLAEGETFVLLGGIAVHEGLLQFGWVIVATMTGGILGDQFLYWLGRRFGSDIINRFTQHQEKIDRAKRLIHRHPALFVIGTRFMYGFRIIGPIIIGTSGLRPSIFLAMNILGALIWSLLFVSLGYYAGRLITPWLDRLDGYLGPIFWTVAAIVLIGVIWKLFNLWRQRTRRAK